MVLSIIPDPLMLIALFLILFLVFLCIVIRKNLCLEIERTSQNVIKAKMLRDEFSFKQIIYQKRNITYPAKNRNSYKQIRYRAILRDHIQKDTNSIRLDISSAIHNRQLYDKYIVKYRDSYSPTPASVIRETGIPEKLYILMEKSLLRRYRIPQSVYDISVNVIISYDSPKGRKHDSKHHTFYFDSIVGEYHNWEKQQTRSAKIAKERSKVTTGMRYDVFKRDGFRCRLCGRSAADGASLEVDHVIPLAKGGLSTADNLQTLCHDCNSGKSDKCPDVVSVGQQ